MASARNAHPPHPARRAPAPASRTTIAAIVLAFLLSLPGPAGALDRYHARYDPAGETVSVEACFAGPTPARLHRHRAAGRYVDQLHAGGSALAAPREAETVALPRLPADDCVHWRVRLGQAADGGDYRTAFRAGDALLTPGDLWLWRAEGDREALVTVSLPEGYAFSTSWPREQQVEAGAAAGQRRYRPVNTPRWWRSRTVFGRFQARELALGGGTVELALAGPMDPAWIDRTTRWVRESALAVVPVLGRLPVDRLQAVVVPIGERSEPVPWAHVLRGGGPAVEFFVDAHRPLSEFSADWTATHEFSHLLLPYVAWNDRWLSEGLASYYQNVLRARDGRLTELEAWQKLHAGFERGRRATRPVPLAEAARNGRGATMRVYWAGAAMMLEADVRLRSGGGGSLDAALRTLHGCCVDPAETWRARELMRTLDRLTEVSVFMDLYREQARSRSFPDLSGLYADLGLRVTARGMELDDRAPLAAVRRAIMRRPAPAAAAGASSAAPAPAGAP